MHPMAATDVVTVFEQCRVSPPPGAVGEKSLPLTFFDIPWLHFPPVHQLCFYEFPHSKSHFTQTIVPNLKHSLSITLQHFFPFSGNLVAFPKTNSMPEIRYVEGDSVSLTFAESTSDFNHLTGNHARKADEFYPLVPQLGGVTKTTVPLLAVQVTLFPNSGICIGLTNGHIVCDGSGRVNFMRAWASITRFGGDKSFLASGALPFYDRTVVKDPSSLEAIFWSQMGGENQDFESQPPHLVGPTNRVRATFVMGQTHIQRLKEWVLAQRPTLAHVSSFTVVCGYVWSCKAKLRAAIGEETEGDELEHFNCAADGRARLDPPIPATYFGNCLVPCLATAKSIDLHGKDSFVTAVRLIGNAIHERFNNKEGIFKGAETWIPEAMNMPPAKLGGVAGSPRFNIYDTDFGWGKPKKCEVVSIDYTGSISLNVCRESEQDLEIGLSLPSYQMDAFRTIFTNGLEATL